MKKILLCISVSLFFIIHFACSAQEDQTDYLNQMVYLRVDSVIVSSFDNTPDWAPPPNSGAVIDGDLLTRWSSDYQENQWICFDFGKIKTLSKIILFWEAAYAVDYDILASLDNQNWSTILSLRDQDGGKDEIEFSPVKARYIKIQSIKRFNPEWGISLWEVLLLGPSKDNPEEKPLGEVHPLLLDKLTEKKDAKGEELEGPSVSPGTLTLDEFQKGVVYTSWGKQELESPASDRTLEYLKELGVTHIGIMVVWMQDEVDSKNIYIDSKDTVEDKALAHAINKAHSLGMKVMLKPHVDIKTNQWRGDIIPSKEWFESYKNFIIYYAKLANLYNVEAFAIGTELVNTTTKDWQVEWEEIIKEVRANFSGKLFYCANWNEYQEVNFWDKLDFIGIDAYFSLTSKKDPTKEELIKAWESNAQEIDRWLKVKEINKPVIFTEIGYCSADGTNIQPWATLSNLNEDYVDEQEQADCLEAMLEVCSKFSWFKGFYWWNYFPQERWSPLGYTIRGKKAEGVFKSWLNKL